MKIVHIITGLGDGGAEHTLYKICKYDKLNKHIVISLKNSGKYYPLIKNLGIEIYIFNFRFYSIYKFFLLIRLLKSIKPNVIQTMLVHADFIGGLAGRLSGIKNIIWNIRYSNLEFKGTKFHTTLILKILALLSDYVPKKIIINSKKARKIYIEKGYNKKKIIFIPNGYDLSILKSNKTHKINFKKKFNQNKFTPIIGNVARYDPQKDHLNLLNALSLIRKRNIKFFCILVGSNIDKNNLKLTNQIRELKLSKYVKLLGRRNDITEIMNGLDIYVQSSAYGEGFPNVVAEAMACGTPCVVTDVGESSFLVNKTGWVVPPNNPFRLADAIEKSINEIDNLDWKNRCKRSTLEIQKNFDMDKMLRSYRRVWYKFKVKNNSIKIN